MKHQKVENQCCTDEAGAMLPFHLCCVKCRKTMAAERRARLVADGTAPDDCGPDVVRVAPARGKVVTYRPAVAMPDGDGGHKLVDMGYRDRAAMLQEDVFDVMTDQAMRRGGAAPFTRHQIGAARDYRALHERIVNAGMKCSRAFDVQTSGHGRVDFMDTYRHDTERLALFHRAIGNGMALRLRRRHAPAQYGHRAINVRDLVDMVCLGDKALSAALTARGWPVSGTRRKTLRAALCAALERMQGI